MDCRQVSSLLLLCLVQFRISTSLSGDPTLTSDTVQDDVGNFADANSNITWSVLPPGESYNSSMTYDARGLDPYYNLVKGFLKTVQPNDPPYDLVVNAISGNFDISQNYMVIVNYGLGFGICFAIGILFAIILPIVGCCFCCCRTCCKRCGGKMLQKIDKNTKPKKIAFCVCLFVCTVLIITGSVVMYVTNDVMKDSISEVKPRIESSLGDVTTYINNMINDVNHVALKGFNFTADVLQRDLNSLGYIIGIPLRTKLNDVTDLSSTLESITNLKSVMNDVANKMIQVNSSVTSLKRDGLILQSNLTTLADMIDNAKTKANCDNCTDTDSLKMAVNFTQLPDISEEMKLLENAQSQDLSASIQEGRKRFDDIPWIVQNETTQINSDISNKIGGVYTEIESGLDMINGIQSQTSGLTALVTDPLENYLRDYVSPYSDYWWYGCLGLASLVAFIVLIQLIGLVCGCVGTRKYRKPTKRTGIANTGGNCLMAATGFIFIFGSLLTIFLAIFFLVGGNMYTIVCRALTDPEYQILELLEGARGLIQNGGYLLPGLLFNDPSVEMPLSGVIQDCQANQPAMKALQLERMFNLNDMLDWRKQVDIGSEIDKLNIDLSDINLITNDTKTQLDDFKQAVAIDYDGFVSELTKNTTSVDLNEYEATLRKLNDTFPNDGFGEAADYLANIIAPGGIYEQVDTDQNNLLQNIIALNESTQSIPEIIDKLLADASRTQEALQNNATNAVREVARTFQIRIEGILDSFVSYANNSLQNDIGKCQPVTNAYTSIVDVTLCQSIITTFNGFWFGLGICVFFMVPSLIFNVKLAKHFRRMKYSEEMDSVHVPPTAYFNATSLGSHPLIYGGKISPQW